MIVQNINILLANGDKKNCLLFKDALEELSVSANITIVPDGGNVIDEITKKGKNCPMSCFLDLTIPRKDGFAYSPSFLNFES